MTMKTLADYGILINSNARGQVRTTCPQCTQGRQPQHQREKDLSVNTVDNTWYCHHCGWTGGIFPDRIDTGMDSRPLSQRPRQYDKPRPMPAGNTAIRNDWLMSRAITAATADYFHVQAIQLFTAPQDQQLHTVLALPYYDSIGHVSTKYRTIDDTRLFWQEARTEQIFFNLDKIDPTLPLIITEGELDAMSVHQAGFPNVVSVPGGAPQAEGQNNIHKFSFMERSADLLAEVPAVIIATDNDGPGKVLQNELIRMIGPFKCRRVAWPDNYKDANDVLVRAGDTALNRLIANAPNVPVVGITTGEDVWQDLQHAYDFGWPEGDKSGLANLDQIARLAPGYLSVWTGHSGSGKSTALDNVLVGLASVSGWRTALYSPEQMPLARHQTNLLTIKARKPFKREYIDRMTIEEARVTNDWASQYFSYIHPPQDRSLDSIIALIKMEVARRGINCWVIDPWNCISDEKPSHLNMTDWINIAMFKLKLLCQETGTHGCLVAHPTKMRATRPGQPEPMPTLTDISGSINFRNQADYGFVVHRDQGDELNKNRVMIAVSKIRMEETGEPGEIAYFDYDRPTARIIPA
jgi:twinkle protein